MRRLGPLLQTADFWAAAALWVAFAVTLWRARRELGRALRPESRASWWAFLVLGCAGLLLRTLWIPHTHYVFDDEFAHFDIARNMAERWRFAFSLSDCAPAGAALRLPQWVPGFHFFVALAFQVLDPARETVFLLNALVGAATVPVAFGAGKAALGGDESGLAVAALLCTHPLHLKFSGCGNLEPLSLLLVMTAILATLLLLRDARPALGALAATASLLAAMTRIENAIIAAIAFAVVLHRSAELPPATRNPLRWGCVAGATLLAFQALISFRMYGYWRAQDRPTFLLSSLDFLLRCPLSPFVLPPMLVAGAVLLWRKDPWLVATTFAAWTGYAVTYTVVHRLDLNAGDFQRYNMGLLPFQLLLAAACVRALIRARRPVARCTLATAALLWTAGLTIAAEPLRSPYHDVQMIEVEWLRKAARALPSGALVCTDTPFFVRSVTSLRTTLPGLLGTPPPDGELYYYRIAPWKRIPEERRRNPDVEVSGRFRLETLEEFRIYPDEAPIGLYRLVSR